MDIGNRAVALRIFPQAAALFWQTVKQQETVDTLLENNFMTGKEKCKCRNSFQGQKCCWERMR